MRWSRLSRWSLVAATTALTFPAGCGGDYVAVGILAQAGDADSGDGGTCVPTRCQSHIYACGDCVDNDGDGLTDAFDPDCLGPCQNSEDSFFSFIPGSTTDRCQHDCYFDQDTGAGNDGCMWSRHCDPLQVEPNYDPQGIDCAYDPDTTVQQGGSTRTCADLKAVQAESCAASCGPLTPNGCDCFGCCEVMGAATAVYLGSRIEDGTPSCSLTEVSNPERCRPCTPVPSCFNDCKRCELCVGKNALPEDCLQPDSGTGPNEQCSEGVQPCGLDGQSPCENGGYCVTGCCAAVIR